MLNKSTDSIGVFFYHLATFLNTSLSEEEIKKNGFDYYLS